MILNINYLFYEKSLSICPTNSTFLTCSDDKSIKLWDSNLLSNQNNNVLFLINIL